MTPKNARGKPLKKFKGFSTGLKSAFFYSKFYSIRKNDRQVENKGFWGPLKRFDGFQRSQKCVFLKLI